MEAIETSERLGLLRDTANATFAEFGDRLAQRYDQDAQATTDNDSVIAFWGSDPRKTATACRSAVFRLAIPTDDCLRQIAHAVEAAAELGLVVLDDEIGMCFLPDGTILPEEDREMWEWNLAEMRAGPQDPNGQKTDNRTLLQKIGGELLDAIGRGNNHQ